MRGTGRVATRGQKRKTPTVPQPIYVEALSQGPWR
jgi:hypothetical protein